VIKFPKKKYNVIYIDPPWSYKFKKPTASKGGSRGNGYSSGVDYYYKTIEINNIELLPIGDLATKDAVCFMWAVNPMLPEAYKIMRSWGFSYKTTITWHKLQCKGMGYWFRGHTEFLIVGVLGKVRAFRSLHHNIVSAPVEKHSRKPEIFRGLIESVTVGMSKIELFARKSSNGWDVWGDEIDQEQAKK